MTDKLIEAVARAIDRAKWYDTCRPTEYDLARAAIAAIEAAGYRIVPVEPTEAIKNALAVHLFHIEPEPTYAAMLAAAPKVTE